MTVANGVAPELQRGPMRVLIVEQGTGLWGAQRYLLRLAPLMQARGFEQILATPSGSATGQAWRDAGWPQVELPSPSVRGVRRADGRISPPLFLRELVRALTLARRIARVATANRVELIHANSHWSHIEAMLASRLTGLPVVLHLHEESEPDALGRLRGLAVLGSDASIAVSEAVAGSLPRPARRRAVVIRNGVDSVALSPGPPDPVVRSEMTSDPDAPLLLVLSRLDPRKRVDHAIRAVAALPAALSNAHLAIAGAPSIDPENGPRLHRLGHELLGERVTFLGSRSDVAELLRAADALVLASSLEGLPLSVLEAQACGLPVVAYPTAGIPEVIFHEHSGLLAAPGDVEDLTRQIARILQDSALRERLARQGRRSVLEQSTLAGQADQQAALLRSLSISTGGL
jgi:glycosyltransferase involved in cell wall biosynthesis